MLVMGNLGISFGFKFAFMVMITFTIIITILTSMTMVPPCAIVSRPIEVVSMPTDEDHKALWEGFREF